MTTNATTIAAVPLRWLPAAAPIHAFLGRPAWPCSKPPPHSPVHHHHHDHCESGVAASVHATGAELDSGTGAAATVAAENSFGP